MKIELILRLIFAGAAMCIGLVLSIALLTSKKTNKSVNFLLLAITIFFIGQTLDSFLMFSGLYKNMPHLVMAVYPVGFLIGAIYYFYIRIILQPFFRFRWYDILHFAFMIRMYYLMDWFYPKPTTDKINILEYLWFTNPNKPNLMDFLYWSEHNFLTIFYLIATLKLINSALNLLKSKSSNSDIEYLGWLKKSTYIFIGIIILDIIRALIVVKYELHPGKSEILSSIIFLGYIIYTIFQIIRNPDKAFYTLTIDTNTKNNTSFKVRSNIFIENISRSFNKQINLNRILVLCCIIPILLICIYFYFIDTTIFQKVNWILPFIMLFLFFMIFQFTIIDHTIIFQNSEVKTDKTFISQSEDTVSSDDTNFLLLLKEFMEREQPYHNANLKSHELASLLETTPHYLSKIINQNLGQNFYTFINSYRVEAFKKKVLLKENDNLTLTAIAEEVGFNSKSSFNRIFKTMTGTTPSEYIKKQKKSANF